MLKIQKKIDFMQKLTNIETFQIILEIYYANRENFDLEFNFQGTGMCKIRKKK